MTQTEALTILKTGANVFLTGEPGSGKTHLINQYAAYLRKHDIAPAITASTGIAATHIGGFTIHSWSGIGIRKTLASYDLEMMEMNERLSRRIQAARVLIIDEISMLDGNMLDLVDRVCRHIKRNDAPFGGMQTVFVGDFFQLPPIAKEGEVPPQFSFLSESWNATRPIICYLSEQHRQEDPAFLDILSALRAQSLSEGHISRLEARQVPSDNPAVLSMTKLFPHNADVDRINEEKLAELPGSAHIFTMRSNGHRALVEQLQRGCLSPDHLVLKIGAKVMFTKNNFEEGFVNGTTGEITGFRKTDGVALVQTARGIKPAEAMEWTISDGTKILAKITQTPLRLAWAITVHKSQGMSLDAVFMDLSRVFEYGQGYVALSRVRTLAGLHLGGLNDKALEVHPDVAAHDHTLRELSESVREKFLGIDSQKIAQFQTDFINFCGGTIAAVKRVKTSDKKISLTEEATQELISQKLSLAKIAQKRGLTVGTILNHLEKLVRKKMIDPDRDIAYMKPEQNRFEKAKTAFAAVYKKEGALPLSAARAMLGEDFSFEELRLLRLFL